MANEGTIRILGIEELDGKLTNKLAAGPVRRMMTRSVIEIRNDSVARIDVDTGRARQSLAWEVDPADMPTWARAGTNIDYGPDLENGTPPHVVDYRVLEPWAQRKGLGKSGAFMVAHKIGEVGTQPHPFLAPAFEASQPSIERFVAIAAQEIEALEP